MSTHGRRVGLRTGYLIGAAGAGIALLAAITRSYPLLCIGVLGAGAGNAANLATRYAASDLAEEEHRARTISIIVWATVDRLDARLGALRRAPATPARRWACPPRPAPTCCRG